MLRAEFRREDLAVAHDDGEEIVKVMRDPSGQPSNRFHLLRLPKLFFALPKSLFRPSPFGTVIQLAQCALNRGHQSPEPLLEHIVRRALMHGIDSQFLPDGGRDKEKRHVRTMLTCQDKRCHTIEARDRIVCQDEVHPAFLESCHKCLTCVDELRLAGNVALNQGGQDEFRIDRIVLELEYAERRFHRFLVR
jgi:hypothetical protein